jgi:uncharacterized protein YeeX (DUF496 family)
MFNLFKNQTSETSDTLENTVDILNSLIEKGKIIKVSERNSKSIKPNQNSIGLFTDKISECSAIAMFAQQDNKIIELKLMHISGGFDDIAVKNANFIPQKNEIKKDKTYKFFLIPGINNGLTYTNKFNMYKIIYEIFNTFDCFQQYDIEIMPPSNKVLLLKEGFCINQDILEKNFECFQKSCEESQKILGENLKNVQDQLQWKKNRKNKELCLGRIKIIHANIPTCTKHIQDSLKIVSLINKISNYIANLKAELNRYIVLNKNRKLGAVYISHRQPHYSTC